MKIITLLLCVFYTAIYSFASNCYEFVNHDTNLICLVLVLIALVNCFPGVLLFKSSDAKLKKCYRGTVQLTVFLASAIVSTIYNIRAIVVDGEIFAWSILVCVLSEALLFWNGIIRVYFASSQLGIKLRIVGIICGMIPIVNLVVLIIIISKAFKETHFEYIKERLNRKRRSQQVCKTKYPILLVHGVFFRDSEFFNYWGRVPHELEANGAVVCYGNHHSASSVADCGMELAVRIREIVNEHGCEKVNIIAHSKGGLDCRYALAEAGIEQYVASLTTINTPHRGCEFADYLLNKIGEEVKDKIADAYNSTLRKLGEKNPDFLAAVSDLTAESCEKFNKLYPDSVEGVYCQSIGSLQNGINGGKFPLNLSYLLVKLFDGKNDGLVSESSFKWGTEYTLLTPKGKRGISHGDMIDLNRENIEGFDVREFYVKLVSRLKEIGL